MKRNWDTIREILMRLEELPDTDAELRLSDFPSDRAYEFSYHVELLVDAGLIKGKLFQSSSHGPMHFFARRLTWSGHEFLDSIRSDSVWNKIKKIFASKGIDMTLELVKSVATEISVGLICSATEA